MTDTLEGYLMKINNLKYLSSLFFLQPTIFQIDGLYKNNVIAIQNQASL